MTRFLDLIEELTDAECETLVEMSKHHRFPEFRLRGLGLLAINEGNKPVIVAGILRIAPQTVYNWARWWREDGLVGILDGRKGGMRPKLTGDLLDTAVEIVKNEPLTLLKIKKAIAARHPEAPDFSIGHLSDCLKKRGITFKRSRLRLKKSRNEDAFIAADISLELMKDAAYAGKIQLFFQDEAGMANIPNVQRSWSPIGIPHEADASLSRKRVNVLGALNYATNTLVHTVHDCSVTRDHVVAFIDKLAEQHSGTGIPIIVVLDNASIHKHFEVEKIDEWLSKHNLILWHIPPYSPELNIIEILWRHAKYHWRKFTSWTKDQTLCEVSKIFCAYGNEFKIKYA